MPSFADIKKIPVEEFTTPSPHTVELETEIKEMEAIMSKEGFRHFPVVDQGKPVGIVSDRDIKMAAKFDRFVALKAADIMTEEPYTVTPNTSLDEVVFEMSTNKYGSALVLGEDGGVMGIFTSTDALNALVEVLRGQV